MKPAIRILSAGLVAVLVPSLALAEVSVQLNRQGGVRRVLYLTRDNGSSMTIWGQVRGRIPLEVMLNPLGDNLGDLAPTIARHPQTGQPWVVWPRNEGNQKRLVVSTWDGQRWTKPARVAAADALGSDQIEPRLLFDGDGVPYLVFTETARPARILFSTLARGVWTPPLPLSQESVDSRSPLAALQGSDLEVTYTTPSGSVTRKLSTSTLLESATNLMDSPIPPGATAEPPGTGDDPGSPPLIIRK